MRCIFLQEICNKYLQNLRTDQFDRADANMIARPNDAETSL